MNSAPSTAPDWTRRPERGSAWLVRFMAWASLRFGRGPSRVLVRAIAAYFFATGNTARQASRRFLERVLGRAPTLAEQYRLFFSFSATVHDRVYFLKDRFDLFDIQVHGAELVGEGGALLMGAHLGSFEVLRACGRHMGQRRVVIAMYEENARRLNAVLAAINPACMQDIVSVGHAGSMLELAERLDEGALVGVLADRIFGGEASVDVDVLGRPAPFPTGPMRLAAALRRRVIFITGLYRGGNRYEIHFAPLADFSGLEGLSRVERERLMQEAIIAYARRVEHFAREAPDNWFNFHEFWRRAA
jgi:predicted LPLAT superfamily acyltransferase